MLKRLKKVGLCFVRVSSKIVTTCNINLITSCSVITYDNFSIHNFSYC